MSDFSLSDAIAVRNYHLDEAAAWDEYIRRHHLLAKRRDPLAGLEMFAGGAEGQEKVAHPYISADASATVEALQKLDSRLRGIAGEEEPRPSETAQEEKRNTPAGNSTSTPKIIHPAARYGKTRAVAIDYYDAHPEATDSDIARAIGRTQTVVSKYLREAGRAPRAAYGGGRKKPAAATPSPTLTTPRPAPGAVGIKPVTAFEPRGIDTLREAIEELGGRMTKWTHADGSYEWLLDGQPAGDTKIITAAQKQAAKKAGMP